MCICTLYSIYINYLKFIRSAGLAFDNHFDYRYFSIMEIETIVVVKFYSFLLYDLVLHVVISRMPPSMVYSLCSVFSNAVYDILLLKLNPYLSVTLPPHCCLPPTSISFLLYKVKGRFFGGITERYRLNNE